MPVFGLLPVHAMFGWFRLAKSDVVPIKIINQEDAPVKIIKTSVKDLGTQALQIKNVEDSFVFEIKNSSQREVISYKLLLIKNIAFEEYSERCFEINSTVPLKPKSSQSLFFSLPKHFREDSYYKVAIKKVFFEDGEIWESVLDEVIGLPVRWRKLEQEIENGDEASSGQL
jgi:hypothetical protein